MPRLSEEKINQIRQSVDIVDVIGAHLPLFKKGRNYVAVCPFHDDSHPSMSISPERQIYMCFVCHNGGNVFTFLKNYLKISYMDAVKKVAEIGRVDISKYQLEKTVKPIDTKLEPLYLMHGEATKIYSHYLNTKLGIEAKEYLSQRNINDTVIETFQIGYAVQNQVLVKAFTKKGYELIDMFRSGLVIESQQGFDRFSDRVMFPLHNQDGRVVGFSGRIFKDTPNEAKYYNSPESDIFIKGDVLYNYHRVKDEVRLAGHVILCEGFMDVIAMYRADIKNVIAIMGTALTNGHINALRKLTKTIYLCLDGDRAGRAATLKCIDMLENSGFIVQVIEIPKDKDPDEILTSSGKDELLAIVQKPIAPVAFKMSYYYEMSNMENYEERKEYLQLVAQAISQLKNEIDQEYYIQELEKKSGFNKEMIQKALQNSIPRMQTPTVPYVNYSQNVKLVNKYIKAEQSLLYYMLEDRTISAHYEKHIGFMFDRMYHIIASYIVDFYRQNTILEIADLINGIEDENIVQNIIVISQMTLPPIKEDSDGKISYHYQVVDDYIKLIKERTKSVEETKLKKALEETFDQKQKAKILEEIIALRERT